MEQNKHNIIDAETLYFTGEDVDPVDDFLGIGKRNKVKKAEKKVKKAEKQLAKGHVKAAERKLKKAEKIQAKASNAQSRLSSAITAQTAINDKEANLAGQSQSMTTPQTTSSPTAYDPVNSAPQMAMPSGGGGGYAEDMGGGSGSTSSTPDDEPTGALAEEKTLGGVTVTAHKKPNMALIGGLIVLILLAVFGKKIFKSVKLK